ncbi:hypothetical protein Taro_048484, partial [Colocasia esculenta]|nr:hypothetical protein [Colocasia esculenta]
VNKEILTTLLEEDPEGSLRESTWISLDRLNRAGIDRSRFDLSDPTQILLSWVDPAGNKLQKRRRENMEMWDNHILLNFGQKQRMRWIFLATYEWNVPCLLEEHSLHAWVNATTSVEPEFDTHDRAWAEGELDDVPLFLEFETPPALKRQKKTVGARGRSKKHGISIVDLETIEEDVDDETPEPSDNLGADPAPFSSARRGRARLGRAGVGIGRSDRFGAGRSDPDPRVLEPWVK